MTQPRRRLVSLEDTPYYHCVARCVRRAYLCGTDSATGANFDHRRRWLVDRIRELARVYAVAPCAYSIMSNHYHVVLKVDSGQAQRWSDEEVACRWLAIYSGQRKVKRWLSADERVNDKASLARSTVATWRRRLYDLSWFMRCLNERIARRANQEDECTGRFWEGRFHSQALLDERALLACMAYVDLNPVRAKMAATPEQSDYTSITARIRNPDDNCLVPFTEPGDGAPNIPFSFKEYLKLVDWAGRNMHSGKRGSIPLQVPAILDRLGVDASPVLEYLLREDHCQVSVLGSAVRTKRLASRTNKKFLKGLTLGKQLCPEAD